MAPSPTTTTTFASTNYDDDYYFNVMLCHGMLCYVMLWSVCLESACLSVCPSACLSVAVCPSAWLSVCMYVCTYEFLIFILTSNRYHMSESTSELYFQIFIPLYPDLHPNPRLTMSHFPEDRSAGPPPPDPVWIVGDREDSGGVGGAGGSAEQDHSKGSRM